MAEVRDEDKQIDENDFAVWENQIADLLRAPDPSCEYFELRRFLNRTEIIIDEEQKNFQILESQPANITVFAEISYPVLTRQEGYYASYKYEAVRAVCVGDAAGRIIIWNAAGKLLESFQAHEQPIRLCFSFDLHYNDNIFYGLITADANTIKIWKLTDNSPRRPTVLEGQSRTLLYLDYIYDYSNNSYHLISATAEGVIEKWDISNPHAPRRVNTLTETTIEVWEAGRCVATYPRRSKITAFARAENLLAYADPEIPPSIKIINLKNFQRINSIKAGYTVEVTELRWIYQYHGPLLACVMKERDILFILDALSARESYPHFVIPSHFSQKLIGFIGLRNNIACIYEHGLVKIWQQDYRPGAFINTTKAYVELLGKNNIRFRYGHLIADLPTGAGIVSRKVSFEESDPTFIERLVDPALGDNSPKVKLSSLIQFYRERADSRYKKHIEVLKNDHAAVPTSFACLVNQEKERCLVFADEKGYVGIYNMDIEKENVWDKFKCEQVHKGKINCLASMTQGNVIKLFTGAEDNDIKILDHRLSCLKTLQGHANPVIYLESLPNGNYLLSADKNNIKLWNINSGRCLTTFSESEEIIKLSYYNNQLACITRNSHQQFSLKIVELKEIEEIEFKEVVKIHLPLGREFRFYPAEGLIFLSWLSREKILVMSKQGGMLIWNLATKEVISIITYLQHVMDVMPISANKIACIASTYYSNGSDTSIYILNIKRCVADCKIEGVVKIASGLDPTDVVTHIEMSSNNNPRNFLQPLYGEDNDHRTFLKFTTHGQVVRYSQSDKYYNPVYSIVAHGQLQLNPKYFFKKIKEHPIPLNDAAAAEQAAAYNFLNRQY